MKLLFFDTETTGLDPEDEVIQLAYIVRDSSKNIIKEFDHKFSTETPIKFEAMATHNITPDILNGCPKIVDMKDQIQEDFNGSICIAHNAKFDIEMLEKHGIEVENFICTRKIAYRLIPDHEKHSLQYLRYALGLYRHEREELNAHDALSDCIVLKNLFDHLLSIAKTKVESDQEAIDTMMKISRMPMMLRTLQFGKHKGKDFTAVMIEDPSYIEWMGGNKDLMEDEDLRYTVKQLLTT